MTERLVRSIMKKVVKFGGSSLASAEQFKKVGDIIRADESRVYVVPSAPGKRHSKDTKVTDMLYGCYALAEAEKDFSAELKAIEEEAAKAKEEGLIRHISFSFHDSPEVIKYIIDTSEAHGVKMESMLCQYNLLDRSNEEMLAYAHEKGLGTVAMGPVGGGRLAAPTDLYAKLTGKPSIATYELAFKFCLGNPNLNCALSGMQNLDMVQKNIKVASDDTAFSEEEWEQLGVATEEIKKFSELYCTGCKYCQPCPVEINIPRIFEIWTYYNVYGLKDHAKNMMKDYLRHGGKTFADCKQCGVCEKKCPQHLAIREHLEKVCKILCE